ncbi:MAG: hypothetical protein V1711_02080 [bacterium]
MEKESERVSILTPGTIILQYLNDLARHFQNGCCFVGLVVGDNVSHRLRSKDLRSYMNSGDFNCHIFLVLGGFPNDEEEDSVMFSE